MTAILQCFLVFQTKTETVPQYWPKCYYWLPDP